MKRICSLITIVVLIAVLMGALPAPQPVQGAASCSPITATIASGFSTGGAGEFCWQASDLGAYVQSWGTDILQINGVDYTNVYATTDSILRDTTGKYYVYYKSATANGHFQASGDSGITSCSARWCSASQFSSMNFPPYTMFNNVWGATSGQTISVQNYNDWSAFATFPETSGVKSYPNASLDLTGKTLGSLTSCTSNFRVTPPTTGSYEAAYDIWVPSEVMIWMYQNGLVGPIAQAWNNDGTPVAAATNVTVGGHTWNVYHGGSNVVSFVRTSNTTSGTVDVLAILNWIKNQGWISSTGSLGKFQFGYEITSAPGGLNFVVNDYNMLCGGLGTNGTSTPPTAGPSPTPIPPTKTNTPAPTATRTSTSSIPTNTPVAPTAVPTATRTNTPVGPTATSAPPTWTPIPPTKTNTPVPSTPNPTDPCASPTVLTSTSNTNVAISTTAKCFKYVNTTFTRGGMFSVMKDASATTDTLKWYGGLDQNVTACASQSRTITGNGGQLNNFTVAKDANGQMYLTITGSAANTVSINIQNWQNGTGCSVVPTVHP